MAEESLNFKFSLDLSDFDKAPQIIDDALKTIARKAEAQGKNADVAMAEYLQDFIKEREAKVQALGKQIEEATRAFAEMDANSKNGNASYEDWKKSYDTLDDLKEKLSQTKDQLQLLKEKEDEVAGNMSLMNTMKLNAREIDLYGKAMSMLPAPIANVIKSTKLLDGALKVLSTNPIIMVIAGIILAMKALSGYADMMANKFETWTVIFGTITEAVRKFKEVITAIITLDWKDFVYNLTTMFDGGAREIQKRNEQLAQSERQVENEKLKAEIQVLRKRAANRKRTFDERIQAQKEANAKELEILENGLKDQAQAMRDFYIDNNLYHPEWNPKGLKTSEEEIDTAQRSQLNQLKTDRMRLEAQVEAQKGINEESLYKLRQQESDEWSKEVDKQLQQIEKDIEAYRKKRDYQRQVREALEAEAERLQAMSTQTENMVIQSQIKEMADGIDKVTKEAELKAKQAFESLERMLRDEAKNLYNNEKSIFEGNPANEGKMFKSFNLEDYARQARKNIGYTQRSNIINNEQTQSYIKAVKKIADEAVKGARKVAVEVQNSINRIEELSGQDLFGSDELNAGFSDFVRNMERFNTLQEDATQNSEELMRLERERLTIEMQIQKETDPDKKKALSDKLKANQDATNTALAKSVKLENDLQTVTQNVQLSFEKIRNTVSVMVDAVSQVAEAFRGISEEGDAIIDAMSQTLDFVGKLASGDYLGAVLQVVITMARGIADMFRETDEEKEAKQRHREYIDNMANIYAGVTDAVISYKQAMIEAKYAEQDLFAPTNVEKMKKAYEQMSEASEAYNKRLKEVRDQQAKQITAVGSYHGVLRDIEKGRETYGKETLMRQLIESGAVKDKNSSILTKFTAKNWYNSLVTGYQDYNNRGELFSAVLAKQGMKQLFDDDGEFDLTAFDELKKKGTDAWNGLDDAVKRQLESLAELKRKQDEYTQTLAESMATYYAPLVDNMTDAWMNWLDTGEDVMDSFRDYSANTFREIVKDQLKQNVYEQVFQPYIKNLSEDTAKYLENGDMDENYAKTLASDASEMMEEMKKKNEQFKKFLEVYDKELEGIGIDINGSESGAGRSAEARGIARASQESVDENNARLAMMQQHTYSINANVAQLVSFSASALEHLSAIHANTNRLERIEKSLSNIETYGIRVA